MANESTRDGLESGPQTVQRDMSRVCFIQNHVVRSIFDTTVYHNFFTYYSVSTCKRNIN